ncbi:hypothetical protein DPMN_136573 [Dreissena polymorpha]|uniref:Uncharacterized protein n=1 Tax=Dreissena polymorpha TaxID=45954 RepID=A0A9D4JDW9_DREPO|nr:hypothetical protein DPMN_136573 [Dreissena polymorpha]
MHQLMASQKQTPCTNCLPHRSKHHASTVGLTEANTMHQLLASQKQTPCTN